MKDDYQKYTPNPESTDHITLSDELVELTEYLAINVHDLWSKKKIKEGWKYGATLDEKSSQTPYLVPYEQLPEHIKEYDRISAIQTLKLILALGYKIIKPEDE
ncbi:MAG: RyR domain-containing protein [Candidatus Thorarchaeota archaeon]